MESIAPEPPIRHREFHASDPETEYQKIWHVRGCIRLRISPHQRSEHQSKTPGWYSASAASSAKAIQCRRAKRSGGILGRARAQSANATGLFHLRHLRLRFSAHQQDP